MTVALETDPVVLSALSAMPVCKALTAEYAKERPFRNHSPLLNTHVTIEDAVMARAFFLGGASNIVVCSTSYGTDKQTYELLKKAGVPVFAKPKGENGISEEKCQTFLEAALSAYSVDGLIDDGGRFPILLNRYGSQLGKELLGVVEQTRGGENCWHELFGKLLPLPVISVNTSPFKKIEHIATAQGVVSASLSAIKGEFASKTVAVIGFGGVGREIALLLMRRHGARVLVVDNDDNKLVEAHRLGCLITTKERALRIADVIITATGNVNIIATPDDYQNLKRDCILINAGRYGEIQVEYLEKSSTKRHIIRRGRPGSLTQYLLPTTKGEKPIYLVGRGFPVNIYVGPGNPKEVLDLIFALMMECLRHIYNFHSKLKKRLIPAPRECVKKVTRLYLKTHRFPLKSR